VYFYFSELSQNNQFTMADPVSAFQKKGDKIQNEYIFLLSLIIMTSSVPKNFSSC